MEKLLLCILIACACACQAGSESMELRFRQDFIRRLADAVPDILKTQGPKTGRFGTGIWIVNDQHPMYPLAVAWATESADNPYYHDSKLLTAIMAAGDALIEDADENGQWVFRKKDGSTWGNIHQPWTYSRWVRAFALVKDAMPTDRRKRWEDALTLGYGNIAKSQLAKVHNIPSHHAMGLYIAGQALNRPDWCEQAKVFMAKVVAEQNPVGYWSEHHGPVVGYNFVYSDALGTYYGAGGDKTVLPALERAAIFHSNFTYPDGSRVETVDERNPYHSGAGMANVGFSFTPEGRGYLLQQMAILAKAGKRIHPDDLASFILYGEEGPAVPTAAAESDRTFVTSDGDALVRRKGPWSVCISAYHCPVYANRWIQDRQNFVSVFHDRCGLIIGGGNTKLQPLWSNFTVGDVSLLSHKPGDIQPNFVPPHGIVHIPSAAGLKKTDPVGLGLTYGRERCSVRVEPVDEHTLRIYLSASAKSGEAVEAHVTLMPRIGQPFAAGGVPERKLGDEPFDLSGAQCRGWISHAGWKLEVPGSASVKWPVLPHNPYVKDGAAKPAEGRIVVTLPFSSEANEHVLTLTVGE